MASNKTAHDRLVKTCNISAVEAAAILNKLCDACRELAIEYDYEFIVSKIDEMAGQRRTLFCEDTQR
ncbi:MAG TPA: hypothetical protein VKA94_04525 [Hyphomicrobiales bacterium]|nr:hypothetical protein [Hyphomicrobiales bacterium]